MSATMDLKAEGWWHTSKANRVRRVARYLRSFGVVAGSRSALRSFTRYGETIEMRAPKYAEPFALRAGTSDLYTFEKVIVEEEYRHERLHRPRCIIDAGANIGCAAAYFARLYPDCLIVAVEPDAENFELLRRNTSAYTNVKTIQAALWGESTTLFLENPGRSTDSAQVHDLGFEGEDPVRAMTIDELLAVVDQQTVNLLKIDVEGAEKEVFESSIGASWLKDVEVIMIELHDRLKSGCSSAFYRAISTYDFNQNVLGEVITITKLRHG